METKKTVRILSLDGGGMKGIVPASIIQYAEAYLQQKKPGTSIADHFDFIAGTSTGGILAGLYLTPQANNIQKAKYSATEALNFYIKEGYKIFNASKLSNWHRLWGLKNGTKYNPTYLETILKDKLGDLLMSQLMKPCIITAYNLLNTSAFFFTSKEDTNTREFLVRDVLRSTSAAPTYFPPAKIKNLAPNPKNKIDPINMLNVDGGVFANNPVLCAYAEARNVNFKDRNNNEPTAKDMSILSLGTGDDFSIENPYKSPTWNLLKWAEIAPGLMINGSAKTVDFQINEIYKSLEGDNVPGQYLRIDIPKEYQNYSSDMSDASPKNIDSLLEAGKKNIEYGKKIGLDSFLDSLLD